MANVWFSVLVLTLLQNAFADVCSNNKLILNCDECMRCEGKWCNQPKTMQDARCMYYMMDNSCDEEEKSKTIHRNEYKGNNVNPLYTERTLFKDDYIPFSFNSPVEREVTAIVYNSTQAATQSVEVSQSQVACDGSHCDLKISATVNRHEFCSNSSTATEYIWLLVKVDNLTEQAFIKYHVPCACECSQKVVQRAPSCSGNGNLTCGVCSCYNGWLGDQCDKPVCEQEGRGDTAQGCYNLLKSDVVCSGNGYCDSECDSCVCYNNVSGSQYFDRKNFCSDLCMETSACPHCLVRDQRGYCTRVAADTECEHDLLLLNYDKELAASRDEFDRLEWVSCNVTYKEYYIEYVTQRTEEGISVMVVRSGAQGGGAGAVVAGGAAGAGTSSKVPLAVGIVCALMAAAAVAGVLVWKHLHAAPAMPFSTPDYQNIDAEDCIGENPLYKPPTSTFTNPQFGKCA